MILHDITQYAIEYGNILPEKFKSDWTSACLQVPTCCSSSWHWHALGQRFCYCLLLCRPPEWLPMYGCVASPTQDQRWWLQDHQKSMQVLSTFRLCIERRECRFTGTYPPNVCVARALVRVRAWVFACMQVRMCMCMKWCALVWLLCALPSTCTHTY
jgi:hypothetical protein